MLYVVAPPLFQGRPEITIYNAIVSECKDMGIEFTHIQGELHDPVECGGVYNSRVMTKYYSDITRDITLKVKDGDKVFWVDGWSPSLPVVWQYCTAEHINVQNYSIWHSSATTDGDYLLGSKWAVDFQDHLIKYTDKIFVATQYLKDSILTQLPKDNIEVTGLPFDASVLRPSSIKEHKIVFGHRWADDKRPSSFLEMAKYYNGKSNLVFQILSPYEAIKGEIQETWEGMVGKGISLPSNIRISVVDKHEYYKEIGKAEFVFANSVLETYGYFVLECILSGANPWLNSHPCYVELYGKDACYGDNPCATMIDENIRVDLNKVKYLLDTSVSKMLKSIME